MGRHPVLGLTSDDPILSAVAPIGLAAAAGTALIVDLVADAPHTPSARTLRDVAADGPSLAELSPGRRGVALIRGGGLDHPEAVDVIETLTGRWPAVVVRTSPGSWPFPEVPVIPLFPGVITVAPATRHAGVWQPVRGGSEPPGPGPVLPLLRPWLVRRLLSARLPRRSAWVRAWSKVWEMPWE
ncbi:MAG: hypothetical protein PVG83_14650 [Acidimicrobiia bacterium]